MLRVAIVDDEAHARTAIRLLLQPRADVEIVAECRDGAEAVEVLRWLTVDLLLLDVQMPGLDGFGVIHTLGAAAPPTVFVTAYDQYALRAFEVEAIDYVLKPFDAGRFFAAFDRARRRIGELKASAWASRLAGATPEKTWPEPPAIRSRLPVPSGNRILFVDFQDIDWIEAADHYVIVHARGRGHILRESLQRLAAKLPADRFARIHRSHAVNIARIVEVTRLANGDAQITLAGGEQLRWSRRYRDALEIRAS
jgi:two-component system, LytTR family, response regulator